jgi:hypothetical protein
MLLVPSARKHFLGRRLIAFAGVDYGRSRVQSAGAPNARYQHSYNRRGVIKQKYSSFNCHYCMTDYSIFSQSASVASYC